MNNILFLCVANSARSQLAEGLARQMFGPEYTFQSAGSNPAFVHPMALQVLAEMDIDGQAQFSKSVQEIDLKKIDLIITLCADEVCPVVSSQVQRLHWPLSDPAAPQQDEPSQLAQFREVREQTKGRLELLKIVLAFEPDNALNPMEFHTSIRSKDLPASVGFYSLLLGAPPKAWTHRYAIFYRPELQVNFVIVVDDGMTLHHDTLYHLGVGVGDKQSVIEAESKARKAGAMIHKPARTTWRGTPLHELWLKDPDGNLIEIYARLTAEEWLQMPEDKEPVFLTEASHV